MTSILGDVIMIITSLLGKIKRKEKILDKDEILAKSREEYKKNNKDEMMLDIMSKAGKLSMEVGMGVVALIIVVEGFFFNSFNFSVWTVYYAILATQSFVYYHRLKEKKHLYIGILLTILGIIMCAAHFIKLSR
ncbi:MAG: DUF6442 family protein [Ezakiella coagulans]|uniref:DUF6442 family protein n=1 Tax=Ezakiella coagulans TaxID=46507 RepID=UPI001FEC9180|nr:DUF6442 family protein [Ezakiella coagulans]